MVAEPTITLLKLKLAGLIVNAEVLAAEVLAAAPAALRATVAMGLVDELLLMVRLPETSPVTRGLNCTMSVVACFGVKVTGKLTPETLKPAPVIDAELIVTGAVPLEVRVTDSVDELPTATSPKLGLAALTVNCGVAVAVAASVPAPLTDPCATGFPAESNAMNVPE